MDVKFTEAMQAWLAEKAVASLEEGALLLLRINNNRAMYQQILLRGLRDKLIYELEKHLRIRLDGHTRQEAVQIVRAVEATAADTAKLHAARVRRGRRADHDELPEKIQTLYEKNTELYTKMHRYHEQLRLMQDAEPCDRYALCQALKKADEQYRRNWDRYDGYEVKKK